MDDFVLDAIFRECGITSPDQSLTKPELFEVIDLINQVGMVLAYGLEEGEGGCEAEGAEDVDVELAGYEAVDVTPVAL